MENYIILSNVTSDEEQEHVFYVKPLRFERGCSVLHQSRIAAGTRLGQDSILAPRSYAQGYVPDNCAVINCDVVDQKTLEARPALKGCLGAGILRRPHHHQRPGWMAIYALLGFAILFEAALVFAVMTTHSVHRYQQMQESPQIDAQMYISYLTDSLLLLAVMTHIRPALLVVAAKWLVIGKQQPGEVTVTDGLIMRYWFFDVLHGLYDLNYGHMVQMRFLSIFTPIVNLYYAAMGARIPWSVILSAMATAQTVRGLELLDFHEEVYLAAEVVFRTHVVLWSAADGKQRVIYQPITMKREAFLGPNSSVMPGSTMEPRAGLMEGSLLPGQAVVKTGTAVVATGQRMPFKHDRETVPSDSTWAYYLRMTFFLVTVRVPMVFIPLIMSAGVALTSITFCVSLTSMLLDNMVDLDLSDFNNYLIPFFLSLPFAYGVRCVACSYIGVPSFGIATILVNKLLMGGLAEEGVKYPYRGMAHARWATCFSLTRPVFMTTYFDPLWKNGTKLPDLMWWIAGVKIGKFADCPMKFPAQPEISMIEVGDYSSVSSITYGHAFGSGYLGFQRVRIGKAVTSKAFLISPGSTVVDGATISPLAIVSKIQEIKEPGQAVCGVLPRVAQRTEGDYDGIFIAPGSKVQPWRFHEADEAYGNDLELGHGKRIASQATKGYMKASPSKRGPPRPCRSSSLFCVLLALVIVPSAYNGLIMLPYLHDMTLALKAEASVKPLVDSYHRFEATLHLKETHKWEDVRRWAEQGTGWVSDSALMPGAAVPPAISLPRVVPLPEADAREVDVPKADVPKADVPKAVVPKADVPKADVPKAVVPKADVLKADVRKADVPKADVPGVDAGNGRSEDPNQHGEPLPSALVPAKL